MLYILFLSIKLTLYKVALSHTSFLLVELTFDINFLLAILALY